MKFTSWLLALGGFAKQKRSVRRGRSTHSQSRSVELQSLGNVELLEPRTMLTGTAPTFAALAGQTLLSGSPLLIPVDGSDVDGGTLTYTVAVTNSTVTGLTAAVQQRNSALKIDVANFGTMLFDTFDNLTPRATEHIKALANAGFFDGVIFHRVINNFMIQGGDPTGTGTGGSGVANALNPFDDQFNTDLQFNRGGLLAMAKSFDDRNDSQFFITETAQRGLDFQHTIFGILVEGESVRDAISNVTTDANNRPTSNVVMTSVDVVADVENGVVMLKAPQGATGSADITVTVTDADGNSYNQTFHINVQSDTINSNPFLDDVPLIRTLKNTPIAFQLTAQDVDTNPAANPISFLSQSTLSGNNIAIPYVADANKLTYSVALGTGVTSVFPAPNFVGTEKITVAVGITITGTTALERAASIDYEIAPIEVVNASTTFTLTANNDPSHAAADDGQADTFVVRANNGLIEVIINGHLAALALPSSVSTLIINGSGDGDTLTVDFSNGSPIPTGGIQFNGGSQPVGGADRLVLTGASPTTVVHTMSNTTDGSIAINGTTLIAYTAAEAIQDDLTAVSRGFVFGDGNDSLILSDDNLSGNNKSQLTHGSGTIITFLNPTNAFEIGLGAGNDTLTAISLDSTFSGNVVVSFFGNDGNDTIDASAMTRALQLSGGIGNDLLKGGTGNDSIAAEAGDDTLSGGAGEDQLVGSNLSGALALSDAQLAGLGTTTLTGIESAKLAVGVEGTTIDASSFSGPVTLTGGLGADILLGGLAADLIDGGSGNDTVSGGTGDDTLIGGAGSDLVQANGDVNFTLVNNKMTGLGTDTLSSFEAARITGGLSGNSINTATFTGPVTLIGGGGNDTLTSGGGNDSISGDAGDDLINSGAGNDSVTGDDGNDILFGGTGSDLLLGGIGNDKVNGQGGNNDSISGGTGDDSLDGGAGSGDVLIESGDVATMTMTNTTLVGFGNDSLVGFESAQLTGGISDNVIDASGFTIGPVSLFGGDGNDRLVGTRFADFLSGQVGNDTLTGGLGNDTFEGGDGTDKLIEVVNGNETFSALAVTGTLGQDRHTGLEAIQFTGGAAANKFDFSAFTGSTTLMGDAGNDTLIGGSGADFMSDSSGDDSFIGNSGNDTIHGGLGKDTLVGGAGDDQLFGDDGDGDSITGGAGNDTLDGGAGIDLLSELGDFNWLLDALSLIGNGTDSIAAFEQASLTGGSGDNSLNASNFGGSVTLVGGDGKDTLTGSAFNDSILGQGGNDLIDGKAGDDQIKAGDGDDTAAGGDGNDSINGGLGDDQIDGGTGNDCLSGYKGNDLLTGGAGNDCLVGGDDNDTLLGGLDGDSLIGGIGSDSIDGQDGLDKVTGGTGGQGKPQAGDTVADAAAEILNTLKIVGTWINGV